MQERAYTATWSQFLSRSSCAGPHEATGFKLKSCPPVKDRAARYPDKLTVALKIIFANKYLLNSEFCVLLMFLCADLWSTTRGVDGVSSFAVENCGLFCGNPFPANHPWASVFPIVIHLDIYFDFAHRLLRLIFCLNLLQSFGCTSVCDLY